MHDMRASGLNALLLLCATTAAAARLAVLHIEDNSFSSAEGAGGELVLPSISNGVGQPAAGTARRDPALLQLRGDGGHMPRGGMHGAATLRVNAGEEDEKGEQNAESRMRRARCIMSSGCSVFLSAHSAVSAGRAAHPGGRSGSCPSHRDLSG